MVHNTVKNGSQVENKLAGYLAKVFLMNDEHLEWAESARQSLFYAIM